MIKKISILLLCLSGFVLAMDQQELPAAKQRKFESEPIQKVLTCPSLTDACCQAVMKVVCAGKMEEMITFLDDTYQSMSDETILKLVNAMIVTMQFVRSMIIRN